MRCRRGWTKGGARIKKGRRACCPCSDNRVPLVLEKKNLYMLRQGGGKEKGKARSASGDSEICKGASSVALALGQWEKSKSFGQEWWRQGKI